MKQISSRDAKALEGMFKRLDVEQCISVAKGAIGSVLSKVCEGRDDEVRDEYMKLVMPVMKELLVFEIFAAADMAEMERKEREE